MLKRPRQKCKARTWEGSGSTSSGAKSPASSTPPLLVNPEETAAETTGTWNVTIAEGAVTSPENVSPEEDPETETNAIEETADEADLPEEGTGLQEEADHQEDTATIQENTAEEDTIGTIAEIEIDPEIMTVEIEIETEGDLDLDRDQGLTLDLLLHQEESEDPEAEILFLKRNLKIIREESTEDVIGIHRQKEMKRTAHLTKKETRKPRILKKRREKQK